MLTVLIFVGLASASPSSDWRKSVASPFVIFGILLASFMVMYTVMALRHPPVIEHHSREASYYYIPGALLIVLVSSSFLTRVRDHNLVRVMIGLWFVVLANLMTFPGHLAVARIERESPADGGKTNHLLLSAVKGVPTPATMATKPSTTSNKNPTSAISSVAAP